MFVVFHLLAGNNDVMIAGGMESMSNAPYLLAKHRGGQRIGHGEIKDSMFLDGLEDAYDKGKLMGAFAQQTANEYGFSRELQDAYAMAWLVIWFQTSEESLGCHAIMPANFDFCNEAPSWTDPANQPGGGGGGALPTPTINPTIDAGAVGCAIFLLILGVLLIVGGGYVAGGIAIGAAISEAANAGTIDWNALKCDLGWYKVYLHNALRALHDLLSLGSFVHPYTHELSMDITTLELLQGFNTELRTGTNILKTKVYKGGYPLAPWSGSGFWFDPPGGATENLETIPAIASAYASGFINDPTNPLGIQSTFAEINWPFNANDEGEPLGYKNSIDSLLAWFKDDDKKVPNVNLDGDRGLGFGEWIFENGELTNPVNIKQP